ncbi:MAG: hypothetical protein IIC76_08080, partial [Bacteroidetes bacterium]|nr:hypothetical protein [Bacteroidota bacterium]
IPTNMPCLFKLTKYINTPHLAAYSLFGSNAELADKYTGAIHELLRDWRGYFGGTSIGIRIGYEDAVWVIVPDINEVRNIEYYNEYFNEYLNNSIQQINKIYIEYSPSPKENYLNDMTAFDTYIEYLHKDNSIGAIGIEVKYTEKGYPFGKKEKLKIVNPNSIYNRLTRKCNIYNDSENKLLANQVLLVVEAKSEDRLVKEVELAKAQKQTKSYAIWLSCHFGLVTDGRKIQVLDLFPNIGGINVLFDCQIVELKERFSELYNLIGKNILVKYYENIAN